MQKCPVFPTKFHPFGVIEKSLYISEYTLACMVTWLVHPKTQTRAITQQAFGKLQPSKANLQEIK